MVMRTIRTKKVKIKVRIAAMYIGAPWSVSETVAKRFPVGAAGDGRDMDAAKCRHGIEKVKKRMSYRLQSMAEQSRHNYLGCEMEFDR